MYRVNPDGSIDVATLEEAVELQQLIRLRKIPLRLRSRKESKANGGEPENEFVQKLKPYDGKEIDSKIMMELTGAKGLPGVGAKLRHMREAGVPVNDYLEHHKNKRGISTWRVKFS